MADTQYITKNRLSQEVNQVRLWAAIIGAPIAGFWVYQLPNFWWIIGLVYLFAIIGAASTKRSSAKGELKTLKLLKKQIHVLAEHLKKNRASTWIDGVVFFSHRSARVKLSSPPSVPVIERKGLVEYILNYQPKRLPANLEKVVQQLITLKQVLEK
ncbi:hypothetical protein [Idiomarina aminovorans]|uniref:hypothetical protein n=1 Tax=Idiomarina aminovorans TaxID=2914829 RepID=UPI0020062BAD|nr:hypothetical protein [Idiomarina sp. ATCH4]MCK7459414.1 hypothetical protein [Idiomarina sp. ATCH4]